MPRPACSCRPVRGAQRERGKLCGAAGGKIGGLAWRSGSKAEEPRPARLGRRWGAASLVGSAVPIEGTVSIFGSSTAVKSRCVGMWQVGVNYKMGPPKNRSTKGRVCVESAVG